MHPLNAQAVDQRDPGSFWTIRLLYGEKPGRYEIYEILASIIGRLQIHFLTWPILTTSPRAMPEWLEGLQSLLSPK